MAPNINHFKFLQTISLLYVSVTVIYTGSSLRHDEECSALFQFKQTIIHQGDATCAAHGSQVLYSWNTSFDCCSWEGVICSDHRDQYSHLIGLDLSERSLCGHINNNSTLFSLVHLQRLNLSGNEFGESQIPSEIARLKQLRSLDLSNSGFGGQIPNEISQLVQLSTLDLSRNALKLHSPSLKDLVQNLTGLEELHLSGVDISSYVPHFLANFSSLRSIKLTGCSLVDEFPATIVEHPKLEVLNLAKKFDLDGFLPEFRNNSLLKEVTLYDTRFFGILPESISHLKHLEVLSLSGCTFSGLIPRSLSNLTQLTYLGLGYNKFTGFVPSLVSLSKLDVLALHGNKFEKRGFPNWLGKLTKLSELYLPYMNINDEIPHFLSNLTQLSVVELSMNSIIGHIPSWLFNYTQLTTLSIAGNQLQGPISNTFSNFKNLVYLNLGSNTFSGTVEFDIFLRLNKLQQLFLGNNNISLVAGNNYTNATLAELKILEVSSCNLKEFPDFLVFQRKLSGLYLDHNNIDGLVPMWFWNNSWENLVVLDLSYNSITGFDQHPHFLPWRNLESFSIHDNKLQGQIPIPPQTIVIYSLSDNNLTGELPLWICDLKYLELLELSYNNMSGKLPSCLGSLGNSLTGLNLRRNNFHGKMTNSFKPRCLLKGLDLSENKFTGELARSLKSCTNLEFLTLGDNNFHDVFPFWMGTLSKLQVLVLRSNNLYGSIEGPTTVPSWFPKLRILDISNNNFSGHLHQNYFKTWNAMSYGDLGISSKMGSYISSKKFNAQMSYRVTLIRKGVNIEYKHILTIDMAIDLSCNNFEGEIPQSIHDLRGIQALNLSNNHFIGHVLPSLWHLKNLEALDLSGNELSGEIPQQLVQLGFLSIFNVSFNRLEGRIPHGKQFDTFDNDSYMGNPRLCGQPLSKECAGSKVPRLPPTRNVYESESLFPRERIDWIIILFGVGSGLAIGIVFGNILYTRYNDIFINKKYRWVRPLHNTKRN